MLKKITSITLISLFVVCILATNGRTDDLSFTRRIAYAPGQIIAKFQPGIIQMPSYLEEADVKSLIVNSANLQNLNEKYGLISMKKLSKSKNDPRLQDVYILKFSNKIDVIKVTKEYSQDSDVIYARPNYIVFYYAAVYSHPKLA